MDSGIDRWSGQTRVRIWDVPVRLFHWLFVAAFASAWLTLGDRYLYLHVFAGYVFAGLWMFRLLWGFAGGGHARFHRFLYGPGAAFGYMRALAAGRASRYAGHNPAGSWAVFGMLALAATLALTGLVTLGGQEQEGPLAGTLGFSTGAAARQVHELVAWLLLVLAGLHVAGVAVGSLVHRENLVGSMLTGRKEAPGEPTVPPRRAVAGVLFVALMGGAALYFYPALRTPADEPFRPYTGPQLADDATWRDECGSCHLTYQPGFLPARSWRALLAGQHDHFGEDLALDAGTAASVQAFLTANAAEQQTSEAAWYVQHTTPLANTPLRVTGTVYWRQKHGGLPQVLFDDAQVHGKGDCAACHLDAAAGTFRDGAMRLPTAREVTGAGRAKSVVTPKEVTQ